MTLETKQQPTNRPTSQRSANQTTTHMRLPSHLSTCNAALLTYIRIYMHILLLQTLWQMIVLLSLCRCVLRVWVRRCMMSLFHTICCVCLCTDAPLDVATTQSTAVQVVVDTMFIVVVIVALVRATSDLSLNSFPHPSLYHSHCCCLCHWRTAQRLRHAYPQKQGTKQLWHTYTRTLTVK